MPNSMDGLYAPPQVADHGTLREWTRSHHLYIGKQVFAAAAALSVVNPIQPPGGGVKPGTGSGLSGSGVIHAITSSAKPPSSTPGGVLGTTTHGAVQHVPGTTGGVGSSGGGTGGGGGSLPFTGFATILAASVGAGLMSAGAWLRWATRRGPRPNTPL